MNIDKSRIIETNKINITLDKENIPNNYRILDIGGGGEGIISMLYKDKVVAIDIRKDELEEVKVKSSLKLVMDATSLSFIDNQFERTTAFFSFMYMDEQTIDLAIKEIYRVLKSGGILEVWDITMPSIHSVNEDVFIAQLEINIDNNIVKTGYGVGLKNTTNNLLNYMNLLTKCSFDIVYNKLKDNGEFYIKAVKR